jgi:hypothetical protein
MGKQVMGCVLGLIVGFVGTLMIVTFVATIRGWFAL